MSLMKTITNMLRYGQNTQFIRSLKVVEAFVNLNGITRNS